MVGRDSAPRRRTPAAPRETVHQMLGALEHEIPTQMRETHQWGVVEISRVQLGCVVQCGTSSFVLSGPQGGKIPAMRRCTAGSNTSQCLLFRLKKDKDVHALLSLGVRSKRCGKWAIGSRWSWSWDALPKVRAISRKLKGHRLKSARVLSRFCAPVASLAPGTERADDLGAILRWWDDLTARWTQTRSDLKAKKGNYRRIPWPRKTRSRSVFACPP